MSEAVTAILLIPLGILLYGGGLLFWPVFRIFSRGATARAHRLRRIFFVTLFILLPLFGLYGVVLVLGRFDHNWLKGTTWFYLINLMSLICSIAACVGRDGTAAE